MPWPDRSTASGGARSGRATPAGAPTLAAISVGAWLGWLGAPAALLAASPTPAAAGDPRSSGEGPGLVGDPLMAILVVAAIGVLALVATLVYVRVTRGSHGPP
jgi:hypothetical protein